MTPKFFFTTIFLMSMMTFNVAAQETKSEAPCVKNASYNDIPNLTDDQKAKIKEIKTSHLTITNNLKNQLSEKKAHLKTITSTNNPNQTEIDATIDQITTLQNKMMKNNIGMRLEIRSQLTDEQKVYFDSHHNNHNKMMRHKKAMKK